MLWASPNYALNSQLNIAPDLPSWWEYSWFGWVGVQVFFVLSGFVIAYTAEGATSFEFIRSRIARLVLGLWIAATISALVLMAWAGYMLKI
ncbi:acyltransferase family protein [Methylomagnum ishizawai]|uniref:acyltransferase family protein n=1 Tax=Methylomagnum ishizawai TaxID=1760988 RepID=UPI001592EE05